MSDDIYLSRNEKEQLLDLLQEKEKRLKYNYISTLFQDEDKAITLPDCDRSIARVNYPKHVEFFNAGAAYTERCFLAGNQTGKTSTGLCELYWHCSGLYPEWWTGKRFKKPITAWLCGDRGEIIRDGMQQDLIGRTEFGTGIIPKDMFHISKDHEKGTSSMPGVPGGIGQYFIKHISGGVSKIVTKTYNSGKNAFESAKVDVIMLDEECPMDIYVECQIRTITTNGIVYLTFTPDSGLTDTVLHFLNKPLDGENAKFVVMVGWDDVPHLSDKRKKQLLATIPIHMRDVKTKGKPYLGAGAIYPIPEEEFVVRPFQIPEYWPKAFSFDPGWRRTAALWGAYDAESDIWYLYSEYYRGQAEPSVHCAAIRGRGDWIEGIADPHGSRAGKGVASKSFLEAYENLGLSLTLASPSGAGSVDIGINEVYNRLSSGRLKVFSTMQDWLYEYRIYRRKENGQIVDTNNHLMDCTRYLSLCGAQVMSVFKDESEWDNKSSYSYNTARSDITGY